MPLPTAISGIRFPTQSKNIGPFYYNGSIYVVGQNANNDMVAFKATDPTASFSEIDAANRPTLQGSTNSTDAFVSGSTLHVAWNVLGTIRYGAVDLATDTWISVDGTAKLRTLLTTSGTFSERWISVTARSNGDVVVVHPGPSVTSMGTTYTSMAYSRLESGVWTTGVQIRAGDATNGHNHFGSVVMGDSDQAFVGWTTNVGNQFRMRALSSTNVLRTERSSAQTVTSVTGSARYTRSSATRIGFMLQSASTKSRLHFAGFIDDTAPAFTVETAATGVAAAADSPTKGIAVDVLDAGHKNFLGFVKSADGDYYLRSDGGGTIWGDENAGATLQAGTFTRQSTNYIERGGNRYIAWVITDGTTVTYNEHLLGPVSSGPQVYEASVSFPARVNAPIGGAGVLGAATSFPASTSLSIVAGAAYEGVTSFGVSTAMSSSSTKAIAVALTLASTQGMSSTNTGTLGASAVMAARLTDAVGAGLITDQAVSLGTLAAVSAISGASFESAIGLTASAGMSSTAAAEIVRAATFAASVAATSTGSISISEAISLAGMAGFTSSGAISLELAAALAVTLSQSASAPVTAQTFEEAMALAASAGASASGQAQIEKVAALAVSLTAVAASNLSATAAANLSAALGAQANGRLTLQQAAALHAALSVVGADSLNARTFDDVMALGMSALLGAAGRASFGPSVVLGTSLSDAVRVQGTFGVSAALAASIAAGVAGALDMSAGVSLSASAAMNAAGGRVITGTVSFPTAAGASLSAALIFGPSISFTARFDAVATSTLSIEASAVLAAQAALEAALVAAEPITPTVELSGVRVLTIDLAGTRPGAQLLTGTKPATSDTQGTREGTRSLAGTMQLTVDLSGRTRN